MPGEFDMRKMQEEAARRAREMQSRARMPQQRRQAGPAVPAQGGSQRGQPAQGPVNQPAPKAADGPDQGNKNQPPPQAPVQNQNQNITNKSVPQPPPLPEASPTGSALESLFQDKERTIILALLILLSSEEGNQELLFALLFLLM